MTILPAQFHASLRERSRAIGMVKLSIICDVRLALQRNEDHCTADIIDECAESLGEPSGTLTRWLWQVGSIPDDDLIRILQSGFSFHHIERAQVKYQDAKYETPLHLLNDALEVGGKDGGVMTVREFETFINGGKEPTQREMQVAGFIERLMGIARLLDWTAEQSAAFRADIEAVVRRHIGA